MIWFILIPIGTTLYYFVKYRECKGRKDFLEKTYEKQERFHQVWGKPEEEHDE